MLSFSQTTWKPKLVDDSLIVITPSQLKQTNLIFLEHEKLKLTNHELENQIASYQSLYDNSLKVDSLQRSVIFNMQEDLQKQNIIIEKLRTTNKNLAIWGIIAVLTSIVIFK